MLGIHGGVVLVIPFVVSSMLPVAWAMPVQAGHHWTVPIRTPTSWATTPQPPMLTEVPASTPVPVVIESAAAKDASGESWLFLGGITCRCPGDYVVLAKSKLATGEPDTFQGWTDS
jgi:hypothetical protein